MNDLESEGKGVKIATRSRERGRGPLVTVKDAIKMAIDWLECKKNLH